MMKVAPAERKRGTRNWSNISASSSTSSAIPTDVRRPAAAGLDHARAGRRAEILFLDEPFSALDYEMTLFMREQLQKLFMESGTTMVLVSHDLEEAVYLAAAWSIRAGCRGCRAGLATSCRIPREHSEDRTDQLDRKAGPPPTARGSGASIPALEAAAAAPLQAAAPVEEGELLASGGRAGGGAAARDARLAGRPGGRADGRQRSWLTRCPRPSSG